MARCISIYCNPRDVITPTCSIYILFGVVVYITPVYSVWKGSYHVERYTGIYNQVHPGVYTSSFNFTDVG
jgi:hypothetical protein